MILQVLNQVAIPLSLSRKPYTYQFFCLFFCIESGKNGSVIFLCERLLDWKMDTVIWKIEKENFVLNKKYENIDNVLRWGKTKEIFTHWPLSCLYNNLHYHSQLVVGLLLLEINSAETNSVSICTLIFFLDSLALFFTVCNVSWMHNYTFLLVPGDRLEKLWNSKRRSCWVVR